MSSDHIIGGFAIKDGKSNLKRLINFILLNYGRDFTGRLYIVDSRSQT